MSLPQTIRGPGLFISQFIGDDPPFNTLSGIGEFAARLGYEALQVPVHDTRVIDLGRVDDSDYISGLARDVAQLGLTISEIAAHRAGQLMAVHPAFNEIMDALAPVEVKGDPARRQARAVQDLHAAISLAQRLNVGRVVTFSGSLAWPFLYPYPPYPAGLIERAFEELARRWRPILAAADDADVDICFEIHPGQDLHDGTTFDRFLALVDHHPRAKILYDPSHMLLQHMDYLGFIDRYHERIAAFHVKDAEFNGTDRSGVYGGYQDWLDRPGRFRSVGDGQVDFRGVFARLTQYGYGGWAVLEWECCLKDALDGAAEGARFIADHIIRVGHRAFDASLRTSSPAERLDRILGIGR